MRIVDEETRKLVMQNRIDALEADNLFENNYLEQEELDDDGDDEGNGGGAGESASNRRRDGGAGDYVVEEADESEDISDDPDGNVVASDSKLKAKRKEKGRTG